MASMVKLMKQAKKLQEDMLAAQKKLAGMVVEGTAGGGAVTAICDGELKIQNIKIDPEVLKEGDSEMLQDMVLAAIREAQEKAKKASAEVMGKVSGGMSIPGLM